MKQERKNCQSKKKSIFFRGNSLNFHKNYLNRLGCLLLFLLLAEFCCYGAQVSKNSPLWVYDFPDYVKGRFGTGLRFNWTRSKLFLEAAGLFPLKEGTVQMWVSPVADLNDFDSYGTLMNVAPAAKKHWHSQMILCLLPPRALAGKNGIAAVIRSESQGRVSKIPLNWKKGEWHALALSWGKKGLSLYIDGRKVAHQKGNIGIDEMPDLVSFGGGIFNRYRDISYCIIDEIEISDCEREPKYIAAYAASATGPKPNEHTVFLNSCDKSNPQGYVNITAGMGKNYPITAQSGSDFLCRYRLFDTGGKIGLPCYLSNLSNKTENFVINVDVYNYYGNKVANAVRTQKVMPHSLLKTSVSPKISNSGWYRYILKISCSSRLLHKREHAFVLSDTATPEQNSADNFLGNHLQGTRNMGVFSRIAIPWERCMGGYFMWFAVEPEKGKFDWRETDYVVKEAKKNNVHLLGILGMTPAWAGRKPGKQWKNKAANYRLRTYPPRDMKEFYNYVYKTVSRYKDNVKYWEVWNEPDWNRPKWKAIGFMGSDRDYMDVLKTAYEAAKKADPNCVILSGGMVPHEHLLKYLTNNGGLKYFDILGMHRYRPWSEFMKYVNMVNSKAIKTKEVWQTEKQLFKPIEVLTEIHTARMNGVSKYFLFDLCNSYFSEHDWSPKPIYYAVALYSLKTAGKKVAGMIKFKRMSHLLSGFIFKGKRGEKTATVCFNYRGPNGLKIAFTAPKGEKITVTDYMGKKLCMTGLGATQALVVPVRIMAYIDGNFDAESFRIACFDEKSYLNDTGFLDIDGDLGIDGFENMKLKQWIYRPKKGRISLRKGNDENGNVLAFTDDGNDRCYVYQTINLGKNGEYELSAAFRYASIADTAFPYMAVWDRTNRKILRAKIWKKAGTAFQRYSIKVKINNSSGKNIEYVVIFGSNGGKGALLLKNPDFCRTKIKIDSTKTCVIDLQHYANQSLQDDEAGDGKGGWVDMGKANMSLLKKGCIKIAGYPFLIKDSCVILGDEQHLKLPRKISDIMINEKLSDLGFLLTAMYVKAKKGEVLGYFTIIYSDKSSIRIPLIRGKNIDDWFIPAICSGMKIAKKVYSPKGIDYALFVADWHNPEPDKLIKSIDFVSNGNAVIALIAASGKITRKNLLGNRKIYYKDWGLWVQAKNKKGGSKIKFTKTGIAKVTIKEPGEKKSSSIQIIRKNIRLENNDKYKFSFDFSSDTTGRIFVCYMLNTSPWTKYSRAIIKITPKQKSYEIILTPKGIKATLSEPHSLRFYLGDMPESNFSISNLKLVEIIN